MQGQISIWYIFSTLSTRTKVLLALISLALLFLITFAIFSATQPHHSGEILQNANHVAIENFKTVAKNVPDFYQTETEGSLWEILNKYNQIPDDTYTTAQIRENSYQETSLNEKAANSSFLIDFSDLKHSFQINFNWQKGVTNPEEWDIKISCPNYTDIIYPDTPCYLNYDPTYSLAQYLPAELSDKVTLNFKIYDKYNTTRAGKPYLEVKTTSCDNKSEVKKSLQTKLDDWLKERYWDPKLFYTEYLIICSEGH